MGTSDLMVEVYTEKHCVADLLIHVTIFQPNAWMASLFTYYATLNCGLSGHISAI